MENALRDALDALREYCARYDRVAIYGAGNTGRMAAKLLEEQGIGFDCFCSTKKRKDFFEGREVKAFDEISGGDVGIVVAVNRDRLQVLELLDKRGAPYYYNSDFMQRLFMMECEESRAEAVEEDGYLLRLGAFSFRRDTLYISCPGGIGDTMYALSLLEAYKREHPEVKRICVIIRERQSELAALFPAADEVWVSDELTDILGRHQVLTNISRYRNYIYGRAPGRDIRERFCRHVMGLAEDTPFTRPDMYAGRGRPQRREKTVVLMPYANSAKFLPETFWKELVRALKENGCTVYTNAASYKEERVLEGTLPMKKGLLETAAFCAGCDAVIALRSGMCDLLAFTDAPLIVLHTHEQQLQIWDLKKVFDRENIYNVSCFEEFDPDRTAEQVLGILGALKS